jgi:hypothetical protein
VPRATKVFVAYYNACVTRGKARMYFDLPKSLTQFQHSFDGGRTVSPSSFNIPLEA